MMKRKLSKGFSLVEILLASSIILFFVGGLVTAHNAYIRAAISSAQTARALYLAEEGLEVMRFLRDQSWDQNIAPLNVNTDYYITFDDITWKTTTTNIYIDSLFERKIRLFSINRNVSGSIVESGGTVDPDSVRVTTSVSWLKNGATTTKSLSTYLTNFMTE